MTKIKMFQSGELQDLQESIDNFCESHEVVDVKITSSTVCNIYDKMTIVVITCAITYKE